MSFLTSTTGIYILFCFLFFIHLWLAFVVMHIVWHLWIETPIKKKCIHVWYLHFFVLVLQWWGLENEKGTKRGRRKNETNDEIFNLVFVDWTKPDYHLGRGVENMNGELCVKNNEPKKVDKKLKGRYSFKTPNKPTQNVKR